MVFSNLQNSNLDLSPSIHILIDLNVLLHHTVVLPVIGNPNWFYLVALSPYAGIYYWQSGDRVDDCSVKLASNDEDTENEITIQGSEEELERMWRSLELQEKGMVKVEGLLEKA